MSEFPDVFSFVEYPIDSKNSISVSNKSITGNKAENQSDFGIFPEINNLQIGDVLFVWAKHDNPYKDRLEHVLVYVGDGKWAHHFYGGSDEVTYTEIRSDKFPMNNPVWSFYFYAYYHAPSYVNTGKIKDNWGNFKAHKYYYDPFHACPDVPPEMCKNCLDMLIYLWFNQQPIPVEFYLAWIRIIIGGEKVGGFSVTSVIQYLDLHWGDSHFRVKHYQDLYRSVPFIVTDTIKVVTSWDPNDKVGTSGSSDNHFINKYSPLDYIIYFENKDSATAPAQEVIVIDTLDVTKLDLATFKLGNMRLGDTILFVPDNTRNYHSTYDMRPNKELLVDIKVSLDPFTGICQWKFKSLDPITHELPEDPLTGFLPPNKTSPEGEGFVSFSIKALNSLETGTQINNTASIFFDQNEAIRTPTWFNTIDTISPVSYLSMGTSEPDSNRVNLHFNGSDIGAGINDYSIYYSEGNSDYSIFDSGMTDSTVLFIADYNKTYSFYSIARDRAGNIETKLSKPDLTFTLHETGSNDIEYNNEKSIFVYPNPVNNDELTIRSGNLLGNMSLQIFNYHGQLVYQNNYDSAGYQINIDVSMLTEGLYIIKIISKDAYFKKFVKN